MSDPALCIPPNPDVSGWWYVSMKQAVGPRYEYHREWIAPPLHGVNGHWNCDGYEIFQDDAAELGYRILGPVPTHAEVEALRTEAADANRAWNRLRDTYALQNYELTAANAEIARLKEQQFSYDRPAWEANERLNKQVSDLGLELDAASAEIARLKSPDLVTVRREDLYKLADKWVSQEEIGYNATLGYIQEQVKKYILAMEAAAK